MELKKRLLSIKETAQILGVSERTIYNGVAPKAKRPFPIKPKRVGRLVKFRIEDIAAYIEA